MVFKRKSWKFRKPKKVFVVEHGGKKFSVFKYGLFSGGTKVLFEGREVDPGVKKRVLKEGKKVQ